MMPSVYLIMPLTELVWKIWTSQKAVLSDKLLVHAAT